MVTRLLKAWAPRGDMGRVSVIVGQEQGVTVPSPRDFYVMLKWYYLNNGLYEQLKAALYERAVNAPALAALRNPANRVVEFYAGKLWPGTIDPENSPESALPISTENLDLLDPIQQIFTWSNWNQKKQVAARWLPMFGDLFVKVRQNPSASRVWFQLLESQFVTQFTTDDRGYLTRLRIDTPVLIQPDPAMPILSVRGMHTEIWEKPNDANDNIGGVRIWRTPAMTNPMAMLGPPDETITFADMGIDFIPIVHIPFRDIGEDRGVGAYVHALDKIDEANIIATRLHQILFRHNKPLWALMAGGVDAAGRPLPAPVIGTNAGDPNATQGVVSFGDDDIVRLPGQQTLTGLVPPLNYAAHLATLVDQMRELEDDLPELTYSRIRDLGTNLSGRALRTLLLPATDRAIEARANAEQGITRALQMAITIGQVAGLFPTTLGTYDGGDFELRFVERPIFAVDELEAAQGDLAEAQAAAARVALGVSPQQALRELEYTEDQIEQFAEENAQTPEGVQRQLSIDRQRRAVDAEAGLIDVTGQAGGDVTNIDRTGGGISITGTGAQQ